MKRVVYIDGMTRIGCVSDIKNALEECSGVFTADVSFEKGTAAVDCGVRMTDGMLRGIVERAGYSVNRITD